MTLDVELSPGHLVRARGREWVVLPGGDHELMKLRPLSGSERDVQSISPQLESVESAAFHLPSTDRVGPQDEAQLLTDAFRMTLRRGAGPFRSAGRISFEPRSYQLVPLMMGMKLETIRLLIADDVGIGKTIEAGLIARELYDRGEIERLSVLCPPHLVKQWVDQLQTKFHFPAVAVTPSSAPKLERDLTRRDSIFRAYPFTVVSLDYVKSDARRDQYAAHCPELSIIDEAHTCVSSGDGQQRYQLVKTISADTDRHMLMLTATPHSGDDEAYGQLLGLINPKFANLVGDPARWNQQLREDLASHYVQRRRVDIEAWNEAGAFPKHEIASPDATYRLTGEHESFLELALDYCTTTVEKAGSDVRKQRLAFWGTLALMRCIGSSPAAALSALTTRRGDVDDTDVSSVLDGNDEDADVIDLEPSLSDDKDLAALIELARDLTATPETDPKLNVLVKRIKGLLDEGFKPIVFCRYIQTANWVGERLSKAFKGHRVEIVTGQIPSDERKLIVDDMESDEKRILVATDCLSEGIDLQELFDAVVHYDLSWNPTRHQQRNGRVDRFGQVSEIVRSLLVYGENNPVDGAVLQVILDKAQKIQKATGVPVPLPGDERKIGEALMKALLLRRKKARERGGAQLSLDFGDVLEIKQVDEKWEDAAEREKANRTVFAQRSLKPEEVRPEWAKTKNVLGESNDVARFLRRSLRRLNIPFSELDEGGVRLDAENIPAAITDRLDEELKGKVRLLLQSGTREHLHRAHPLVSALAELLVENSLDEMTDSNDLSSLPRAGVWTTAGVSRLTTVVVLRVRHQIETQSGRQKLMAEETDALAFAEGDVEPCLAGRGAFDLLNEVATDDTSFAAKSREARAALDKLKMRMPAIESRAIERAQELVEDHRRVRDAIKGAGRIDVVPIDPVDVIGLYVLMPELD